MECWCMFFKVSVYRNYSGVAPLLLFRQHQNYWTGFQTHLMFGSLTKIFRETCQWLKFTLNGLWAQSRVSPVVGLLPLASGPECLGMAFPPFLVKELHCCDSVVITKQMHKLQSS